MCLPNDPAVICAAFDENFFKDCVRPIITYPFGKISPFNQLTRLSFAHYLRCFAPVLGPSFKDVFYNFGMPYSPYEPVLSQTLDSLDRLHTQSSKEYFGFRQTSCERCGIDKKMPVE